MLTVKCCVCKRVRSHGRWMEASDVDPRALISHTYCPGCLKKAKEEQGHDFRARKRLASI